MQKGSAKPKGQGIRATIAAITKGRAKLVAALGLLTILGLGYFSVPSIQGTVNGLIAGGPTQIIENIRKAIAPTPVIVKPVDITASSAVKDHPASLVWDEATNTDWQGTGDKPELTVTFKDKIDLMFLIVYPGNSQKFVDFRRPSKIEVVFPDGSTKVIDLVDDKKKQPFEVTKDGISSLVIRVLETNGPEGAPISISELEFNKKS